MRTLFAVEPGSEAGFEQLPDPLPVPFERIELPGELLDVASIRKRLLKPVRGLSFGIADVVSPELARRVAEADLPVRLEFQQLFRERCRRASELRASELTADFDFTRAAAEPEYRERLRLLLRGCYGILEEFHMTLRFPVRIDFAAGEDAAPPCGGRVQAPAAPVPVRQADALAQKETGVRPVQREDPGIEVVRMAVAGKDRQGLSRRQGRQLPLPPVKEQSHALQLRQKAAVAQISDAHHRYLTAVP